MLIFKNFAWLQVDICQSHKICVWPLITYHIAAIHWQGRGPLLLADNLFTPRVACAPTITTTTRANRVLNSSNIWVATSQAPVIVCPHWSLASVSPQNLHHIREIVQTIPVMSGAHTTYMGATFDGNSSCKRERFVIDWDNSECSQRRQYQLIV